MQEFEALKAKYNNLIKTTYEANIGILIESFVEYYGEHHRKLITKKINEIVLIYYVDFKTLDDKNFKRYENKPQTQHFLIFKKYKEELEQKRFLSKLEQFIGTTDESILKSAEIRCDLRRLFEGFTPTHINITDDINTTKRLIIFPIGITKKTDIIHEINHAITSELIGVLEKKRSPIVRDRIDIVKSGLDVSLASEASEENILEELINERASVDIAEIFRQKGGNFESFCFDIFPFSYAYENHFYLIEDFYRNFIHLLKKIRITENKNLFIEIIGKDNYKRFVQFINRNYKTEYKVISSPQLESEARSLVQEMIEHANSYKLLTQNDVEHFYDELRKQGFKVTPMEEIIERGKGK